MDSYGVDLLRNEINVPSDCRAVLFVEFDSNLDRAGDLMISHIKKKSIKFLVETDAKKQASIMEDKGINASLDNEHFGNTHRKDFHLSQMTSPCR